MRVITCFGRLFLPFLLLICLTGPVHSESVKKPIKIVFSTYWPTSYEYLWLPIKHFAQNVEKRSSNRVKFELHHSKQLFDGFEEFKALERGDIDMSSPLDIYNIDSIPEFGISSLPFLYDNIQSLENALDAGLWDLGITQKLLDHNIVVLNVSVLEPYQIYSRDFQVISPKDIKDKKWGVSGATHSKAIEILGGIPELMSSGKLYMEFQKGKINGCTRPLLTGYGRQLYEVIDYITINNFSLISTFLSINKDKWDSLPEDIQTIIKEEALIKSQEQTGRLNQEINNHIEFYKKIGVKLHFSTKQEIEAFRKAMLPVYDWWLKKVPDGQKYINFVKAHR
ncbi:MAG: TRAP transporter substrate-binding protein DctP [Pseudomonadota bacterium]